MGWWVDFPSEYVRLSAENKLQLSFRVEKQYVDLYSLKPWRTFNEEFEGQLSKRTGWIDVQMDWERMYGKGIPRYFLYDFKPTSIAAIPK